LIGFGFLRFGLVGDLGFGICPSLGTDSARQPTVNELTLCSHKQSAAATVRLIRLHLKSYAKLQTSNCLTKLNLIPITFSMLYYCHHL